MAQFIKNVEVSIRIDELEAMKNALSDYDNSELSLDDVKTAIEKRIKYLESEKDV